MFRILVDATESWDRAPRHPRQGVCCRKRASPGWRTHSIIRISTACLHLAETLEIPVAGGEHLYDLHAFQELLQHRAVDIAIIDLARAGGITPWRRIAALAQAHHVPVCGHVIPEIHVHLLSAIPHAFMVENVPRSAAILQAMPALEDGCLVAPKTPGLGLNLDEAASRVTRWLMSAPAAGNGLKSRFLESGAKSGKTPMHVDVLVVGPGLRRTFIQMVSDLVKPVQIALPRAGSSSFSSR